MGSSMSSLHLIVYKQPEALDILQKQPHTDNDIIDFFNEMLSLFILNRVCPLS